jgi:hypothetical protein
VLSNGLDHSHYTSLHGLKMTGPAQLIAEKYQVRLALCMQVESRLAGFISGAGRREIHASFTALGAGLALAEVFSPLRLQVLFSGSPDGAGYCLTRTVFFVPPNLQGLRGLIFMIMMLRQDVRLLNQMQFRPNFLPSDGGLKEYFNMIGRLGKY